MGKKARARKAAEAAAATLTPGSTVTASLKSAPTGAAAVPRSVAPMDATPSAEESLASSPAIGANPIETAARLHSAAIHVLRRVRREDQSLGLSAARLSAL